MTRAGHRVRACGDTSTDSRATNESDQDDKSLPDMGKVCHVNIREI